MCFDHLDLFQISEFEFRICNFIDTSRACVFARVISLPMLTADI